MRRYALVGTVLAALALAGGASAADYTWTGASSSPNWSAANWTSGAPTDGEAVGTLSFPANVVQQIGHNDLTGLTADALSISQGGYQLTGNTFGLGAGGLRSDPAGVPAADGTWPTSRLEAPLDLLADQTWMVVGKDAYPSGGPGISTSTLAVSQASGTHSLNVDLSSYASLGLTDVNTGALTISGSDPTKTGVSAFENGVLYADDLNGTTAAPVTVRDVRLDPAFNPVPTGPLSLVGAQFTIGERAPADVQIHGDLSLDSATATSLAVVSPDSFGSNSKLEVTGNANLGGSLQLTGATCQVHQGDTVTLLTATGTVNGTFANVPNGGILPFACSQGYALAVHYSAHAVTGTVVPIWDVTVRADPEVSTKGQPITITASVAISTPSPTGPAGTIEAGCGFQPVDVTGATTGKVVCHTTSAPSPGAGPIFQGFHSISDGLQAKFHPTSDPSYTVSGADPAFSSLVQAAPTSTVLRASSASVRPGRPLTLTARVGSAGAGLNPLDGTVSFNQAGRTLSGCIARPLVDNVATCSVAHPPRGTESFQAFYLGTSTFVASHSSMVRVQVEPGTVSVGHPQLSGSRLALPVRCSGAPCTVEVTLTSGRSTYARDKATIRPERAVYHLRLSTSAARSLARHHRLAATLRVTQVFGRSVHSLSRRSLTFRITRR